MKKQIKKKQFRLTLILKIQFFFSNLWFKYIKHPIQKRKEVKDKIKYVKNLKKQFEKDFNVDHNEVKMLIGTIKEHQTNKERLNDELVKGRKNMIKIAKWVNKVPFYYEPEIIDIHNENLDTGNVNPLESIMRYDYIKAKNSIKEQANKIGQPKLNRIDEPTLEELRAHGYDFPGDIE